MNGILLVDKPPSMTSHDVVNILRKKLNVKKVGHAGTLDPAATGLLLMLVGAATKQSQFLMSDIKAYSVAMTLGTTTHTADHTGTVLCRAPVPEFDDNAIKEALSHFQGEISQVPPMVSAKKVKGKKLYVLARKGLTIERPAQNITIYDLVLRKINLPEVCFDVRCSKGTYIRTLCEDIGKHLGCGAHMSALRRTACAGYSVSEAVSVDELLRMSIEAVQARLITV